MAKKSFDGTKVIMGAISIVIGLVLLPLMAGFSRSASYGPNATGVYNVADTNVTGVAGLTSTIDLVVYGFTFGLVGLGVGMIYLGFRP